MLAVKRSLFAILLAAISGVGLHPDANAQPADKEKMFPDGDTHDFGKVPQGAQLYHAFRIVNTSDVPLRIVSASMSSRGLDRAAANKNVLKPNEEGLVEVFVDTRTFLGARTRTIYVSVDNGKLATHRLCVGAVSIRTNEAFFPDEIDFGKMTRGDAQTRRMIVAVPDQPKLQVTAAKCDNKFIEVSVKELGRGKTTAIYQVSATVLADIPAGELHEHIELTTNNPGMPKLRVPVRAIVEPQK
jgi:Protein of unknown function (DUF1573)